MRLENMIRFMEEKWKKAFLKATEPALEPQKEFVTCEHCKKTIYEKPYIGPYRGVYCNPECYYLFLED